LTFAHIAGEAFLVQFQASGVNDLGASFDHSLAVAALVCRESNLERFALRGSTGFTDWKSVAPEEICAKRNSAFVAAEATWMIDSSPVVSQNRSLNLLRALHARNQEAAVVISLAVRLSILLKEFIVETLRAHGAHEAVLMPVSAHSFYLLAR